MKTIRVSAAVIHDGGMIYATRRGKGEFKGGWEFPGGKREEGEDGEQTVVREIREELGTLSEHDEARWLALEDIGSVAWLPADTLVVDLVRRHFSKGI